MKQLILPLELPPTFGIKDFIVSPANEEAYLWVMRWPNWPNRSLVIYGDGGCGKTHLSTIWQKNTQAQVLKGEDFKTVSLEALFSAPRFFIIDNAHLIDAEEKLFHFYNHLTHSQGSLLFLSRRAPSHWGIRLPDLRSRLNATPAVKIHQPDEELLSRVIQKLFHDHLLKVDEAAISFLLKYIDRSFESVWAWVELLNEHALIQNRSITVPLVKEVFEKKGWVGKPL